MGPKNRGNDGGSCLLTSALIVLALIYGGITLYILNRGEMSRKGGLTEVELFPRGHEGDLATHPHLQHHDLSSLLLEGLPPLRSRNKLVPAEVSMHHKRPVAHHRRPIIDEVLINEAVELNSIERSNYLRSRMPID